MTVTEVNVAPVLDPVSNRTIAEHSPFSLLLQATDSDVPTNTLSFAIVSGPPGASTCLTVTGAGDVIAVGTREPAGVPVGVWAAKFDGGDRTRRRPIVIRRPSDSSQSITVDDNDDVILAGDDGSWVRKYDAAVFGQPVE